MNFLFINYSINWVYLLYKEYILSFNEFIKKYYYEKNINIEIKHFDIENLNLIEFEDLNFLKYDKIFYSGNLTILKLILYNKNYDLNNFFYVNIEQMSIPSYFKLIKTIDMRINIIDYSEENIPYLTEYKNTYLFPPYFDKINSLIINKDINILSIVNNNYRKNICKNINTILLNKHNIMYLDGCYGKERDDYFLRTKIYINIHCSELHQTMELIRLTNLIMNKVIILSQKSICTELLFLKNYIIICNDINDFIEKINDILNNYDKYYNKIYENYDKDCDKYYLYIKNNIDKIILI
jgi:hypothetical protein